MKKGLRMMDGCVSDHADRHGRPSPTFKIFVRRSDSCRSLTGSRNTQLPEGVDVVSFNASLAVD